MAAKEHIYAALYRSGLHRLFGRGSRGAILMLHRIVPAHLERDFHPNRQFAVTPDVLYTILDTLEKLDVEAVSLDEAHRRLTSRERSKRFACLTFDDGYRDNLELAYPICSARGVPMTTYVTTGFLDRTDPVWWFGLEDCLADHDRFEARLERQRLAFDTTTTAEKNHAFDQIGWLLQAASREARHEFFDEVRTRFGTDIAAISDSLAMTWPELVEYDLKDGVTVGAHTVSHPALSTLPEDEMTAEIEDSRRNIESHVGHPVKHFAYPYGDITTTGAREVAACRKLDFLTATTTRHSVLRRSDALALHDLPRIPTDPFETERTIAVKLCGVPGRLQSLRHKVRRTKTREPAVVRRSARRGH